MIVLPSAGCEVDVKVTGSPTDGEDGSKVKPAVVLSAAEAEGASEAEHTRSASRANGGARRFTDRSTSDGQGRAPSRGRRAQSERRLCGGPWRPRNGLLNLASARARKCRPEWIRGGGNLLFAEQKKSRPAMGVP